MEKEKGKRKSEKGKAKDEGDGKKERRRAKAKVDAIVPIACNKDFSFLYHAMGTIASTKAGLNNARRKSRRFLFDAARSGSAPYRAKTCKPLNSAPRGRLRAASPLLRNLPFETQAFLRRILPLWEQPSNKTPRKNSAPRGRLRAASPLLRNLPFETQAFLRRISPLWEQPSNKTNLTKGKRK